MALPCVLMHGQPKPPNLVALLSSDLTVSIWSLAVFSALHFLSNHPENSAPRSVVSNSMGSSLVNSSATAAEQAPSP